jgi:excinuclease ABC subunit C
VDVVGLHRFGDRCTAVVLAFRDGRLESTRKFRFASDLPEAEVLSGFVTQLYGGDRFVPAELLLPAVPNDAAALAGWLREKRDGRVELLAPKRGRRQQMLAMAAENAKQEELAAVHEDQRQRESLERVQQRLGLLQVPGLIHGLDISTIQGHFTVASRVAFRDGRPDKAGYRRFRIRTVSGQDDFAAMAEALLRSLRLCLEDADGELPDLLLIDGGKGQLSAAVAVVEELGLGEDLVVVSLAKDKARGRGDRKLRTGERVFVPGQPLPLGLAPGDPETLLLTHVRDEAHRFAIT